MDSGTIEVTQFVNGNYESQHLTLEQIISERERRSKVRPKPRLPDTSPQFGILSRTIVPSAVIDHILPARIRDRNKNDVVFVGTDFIHIKEIHDDGHLEHVYTKTGLPRIRSARVFGEPRSVLQESSNGVHAIPLIKTEAIAEWEDDTPGKNQTKQKSTQILPPQFLILTLESHDLMFLYAISTEKDDLEIRTITYALPAGTSRLDTPGAHLTVDPKSRAVAVAAAQDTVVLYATSCTPASYDNWPNNDNATFVKEEKIEPIRGSLLKMEFLYPEEENSPDNVILLILHARNGLVCMTYFEWSAIDGLNSVCKRFESIPLSDCQCYPLFLIPLRFSSDCLIVAEEGIYHYRNILAEGVQPRKILPPFQLREAEHVRKLPPRWASWARMDRNHHIHDRLQEDLFLIREDGVIFYAEVDSKSGNIGFTRAGSFEGNIDRAFASLPLDLREPDHLVAAGSGSNGMIKSIGQREKRTLNNTSRKQALTPKTVEILPNWAPSMDLIVTTLLSLDPTSENQTDKIFMTSGQAPYGNISELRQGLRAQILGSIPTDIDFSNATGLWQISGYSHGDLGLLISFPTHTEIIRVFTVIEDGGETIEVEIGPPDGSMTEVTIDQTSRTLAAAYLGYEHSIQVTRHAIILCKTVTFKHLATLRTSEHNSILAAAIHSDRVVVALSNEEAGSAQLRFALIDNTDAGLQWSTKTTELPPDTLGLTTLIVAGRSLAIVSTRSSELWFYEYSSSMEFDLLAKENLDDVELGSQPGLSVCESIVVLPSSTGTSHTLLCGLRDGKLLSFDFDLEPRDSKSYSMPNGTSRSLRRKSTRRYELGRTSVHLYRWASEVYAVCDTSFCRIDRLSPQSTRLDIQPVWLNDVDLQRFQQSPVTCVLGLSTNKTFTEHGFSDSLLCLSGTDIYAVLPAQVATPITSHAPVTGSPFRAVPDSDGCILFAQTKTTVNSDEGSSELVARTRDSIILMDPQQDAQIEEHNSYGLVASYELPHRDKVNCVDQWAVEEGDSIYTLFVVGITSFDKESDKTIGRLLFLQKRPKGSEIELKRSKSRDCWHGPVYAISGFHTNLLIYSTGTCLVVIRYDLTKKSLVELCKYTKLLSPAVQITTKGDNIYVATVKHSVHAFVYKPIVQERATDSSPYTHNLEPLFSEDLFRNSTNLIALDIPASTPTLIPASYPSSTPIDRRLILVSDKSNSLAGILEPLHRTSRSGQTAIFEAELPRAVTRLRRANTRPLWAVSELRDVLPHNIIGSAADGTLFSFQIIGRCGWQVLKVLECLLIIAAHAQPTQHRQSFQDEKVAQNAREVVLSIAAFGKEDGVEYSAVPRPGLKKQDYHVDGDTLMPLRGKCLQEELKELLSIAGERIKVVWDEVVEQFLPENVEDREAWLEDWIVDLLGPVM